jgi:hypothetical protein
VVDLAASPALRVRLARNALSAVKSRTWEAALGRLADGYRATLVTAEQRRTQAARRAA